MSWIQLRTESFRTAAMLALSVMTIGAALPLQAQTDAARAQAPAVTHNTWTSGAAMPTADLSAVGMSRASLSREI